MKKLNGKVAVVTGASKGIGAAIAKEYAANGAAVVVNYSSSKEDAERVVKEIVANDGKAIAVQGSVANADDVKRIFDETKKAFGKLDILVNNAGIYKFTTIEEVTEEEFHRQFNTNVLGILLSTREAIKHFTKDGGSIINVSSVVSTSPMPGTAIYAATKGAVDTMTIGLARELAGRKIRVNNIAPGGVETEGSRTLGMIGSDMEKNIVAQTPLGRIGQPQDIAKIALFLASDDSAWVTGERIQGSGGLR
ncbi:glucose 1-dehydrogenase [Bdellovibrio sp. SKB1291214]|uniref:SDR family NAD(P)-dependent oxidoreductase n=1 Tax=Bdellovibrio sp. SKB1291214 TaxID=1732569 RepID=UPI000B5199D7|nr:glucose 1-dehydrogenase [Bdellovibrio sp. SKB1291214]UYL07237.1 glucose 1-dehydrogenase [Bdellovibrio sp. SKB1291214]